MAAKHIYSDPTMVAFESLYVPDNGDLSPSYTRLVGQEAHTGSITVGKTADLVLVQGDPSTRIGDLRQTRLVMLDGKMMNADDLRAAAGFSGRPK